MIDVTVQDRLLCIAIGQDMAAKSSLAKVGKTREGVWKAMGLQIATSAKKDLHITCHTPRPMRPIHYNTARPTSNACPSQWLMPHLHRLGNAMCLAKGRSYTLEHALSKFRQVVADEWMVLFALLH